MSTSLEMPLDVSPPDEALTPTRAETITPRRPKSWLFRLWYGMCAILEWLFGLTSLVLMLAFLAAIPLVSLIASVWIRNENGVHAFLAAIPIVNLVSLGYLLD